LGNLLSAIGHNKTQQAVWEHFKWRLKYQRPNVCFYIYDVTLFGMRFFNWTMMSTLVILILLYGNTPMITTGSDKVHLLKKYVNKLS